MLWELLLQSFISLVAHPVKSRLLLCVCVWCTVCDGASLLSNSSGEAAILTYQCAYLGLFAEGLEDRTQARYPLWAAGKKKTMARQHIENGLHSDTTCPKQTEWVYHCYNWSSTPLNCHTEALDYKWCSPCYTGSYGCWRHNWKGNTWAFTSGSRERTTTLLASLILVMVRLQELQGLLGVCSHLLLHTTQRSKEDGCLSPNSGLLVLFSFTTCSAN